MVKRKKSSVKIAKKKADDIIDMDLEIGQIIELSALTIKREIERKYKVDILLDVKWNYIGDEEEEVQECKEPDNMMYV